MDQDSNNKKLNKEEVLGEIAILKAQVEEKLQPIAETIEIVAQNMEEIFEKLDEIEEETVKKLESALEDYEE